jgi:hypothetical protein
MLYSGLSFNKLTRRGENGKATLGNILKYDLELLEHPTRLGKLLGKKPRTRKFAGSSTIWYHVTPKEKGYKLRCAGTCWEYSIVNILETAIYNGLIKTFD